MSFLFHILTAIFRPLNFWWWHQRVRGWRAFWPWRRSSNVVLITWSNALGDSIVALPAMKMLAQYYHQHNFQVIGVSSGTYPKLQEEVGIFDQIIYAEVEDFSKDKKYRLKILKRLYALRAEIQIDMISSNGLATAFMLALLPDAKTNYKLYWFPEEKEYRGGYWREKEQSLLNVGIGNEDHKLLRNHMRTWRQRLWREWHFVRSHYDRVWCLHRNENEMDFRIRVAMEIIGEAKTAISPDFQLWQPKMALPGDWKGGKYFVIVPGGNNPRRRWPAVKFSALISQLCEHYSGYQAIVIGSKSDVSVVDEVMKSLPAEVKCVNCCGKTSFAEMIGIINGAEWIISNDTGAAHVAGYLQKRTFCLMTGVEGNRFFPNEHYANLVAICSEVPCAECRGGCFFVPYPGGDRCMTQLSVIKVFDKITKILTE